MLVPWRRLSLLLVLPALASEPASAHAIVIAASPAVDAVVAGPAVPIELRFNSRIDHERSRLLLFAPDGSSVILPLAPETAPDILSSNATAPAAGAYRLRWQVLSVDGHITRGDIPFTVDE